MRILLKGFTADGFNEPLRMSVLIENDRIIAVEKDIYGSSAADKVFLFKDEIIAPGFIDSHGHSDISLLASPAAESKRRQGITGEITGNCGLSVFPVNENNREHLQHLYAVYQIPLTWNDLPGYQKTLTNAGVDLRTWSLCGHNTLRAAVAGYEEKILSDNKQQQMEQLLEEALISGSPGLSSGLLYTPGCFADSREIIRLMKVLARHDAVYATHLRSEGTLLLESLEETLSAAHKAGLKKVLISHFKTAGKDNWQKIDKAVELMEDYRAKGIDVRVDRYPYVESQTMLSVILPPPFDTMTDREVTRQLQDQSCREALLKHLKETRKNDWVRWRITGTTHPVWKNFAGKKYSDLPADPEIAVIEQLAHDATTATIGAAGMSEENMHRIIALPWCMAGSDGNALPENESFGRAHPRAFGAIAKFIRLKLDHGESIGQTVSSVTGKTAEFFSITEAGTLTGGKKADITVFSPEEIDSKADFLHPHRFADGIRMTMTNGKIELY